jgi:putative acetyltransferase
MGGFEMITIRQIATPEDCAAAKALVLEFVAWCDTIDPDAQSAATFSDLQTELDALPGIFGPPGGSFLLARNDGKPVGCVAFRETATDSVEVKRMFVRPDQRGQGVGQNLVRDLIALARARGRKRMELSSYHTMTGAHKIYRSFGFRDVPAPADLPELYLGRIVFMEMDLV